MDEYVKFHNQTAGRDKFFRLVQYTSRIVWSSLERKNSNPLIIEKVKRIDEVLGLMRRILRFGRFFETLHSAIPMISSSLTDSIVRFTITMSRIANSCFMFIDHVVCLDKLGILPNKLINSASWDKLSTKFWLYAILLGLIRDAYEILKIYKEEYKAKVRNLYSSASISSRTGFVANSLCESLEESEEVLRSTEKISNERRNTRKYMGRIRFAGQVVVGHADVAVDSAKNVCDLFLPLNSLGFIKLSPGIVGFLGAISTILSAIPQINPMVKMVPGA